MINFNINIRRLMNKFDEKKAWKGVGQNNEGPHKYEYSRIWPNKTLSTPQVIGVRVRSRAYYGNIIGQNSKQGAIMH